MPSAAANRRLATANQSSIGGVQLRNILDLKYAIELITLILTQFNPGKVILRKEKRG